MNSFFKGIVFGAGLGGATGLFFAPKKGKELQQQIDDYIVDLTNSNKQFQTHLTDLRSAVKETSSLVATSIPDMKKSIQKDIDSYKFQTDARVTRVNNQLGTLKEHLEEAKRNFKKSD